MYYQVQNNEIHYSSINSIKDLKTIRKGIKKYLKINKLDKNI